MKAPADEYEVRNAGNVNNEAAGTHELFVEWVRLIAHFCSFWIENTY